MRPIDADALDVEQINCCYGDHCRTEDVQEWLDEAPTLDYAPVRHGEWKFDAFTAKHGNPYRCSICEEEFDDTHNYCPSCGTKMNGWREEG